MPADGMCAVSMEVSCVPRSGCSLWIVADSNVMCLKARVWADCKVTNEFVPQGVPNFSAVDLSGATSLCERDLRNCTISPPVSDKGAHVFHHNESLCVQLLQSLALFFEILR